MNNFAPDPAAITEIVAEAKDQSMILVMFKPDATFRNLPQNGGIVVSHRERGAHLSERLAPGEILAKSKLEYLVD